MPRSRVQREIIGTCRDDFAKYAPRADPTCLDAVLLSVARTIGDQIKYARLDRGHSGPTNRRAFDVLRKARLIHKIASCDPSGLPLGAVGDPTPDIV